MKKKIFIKSFVCLILVASLSLSAIPGSAQFIYQTYDTTLAIADNAEHVGPNRSYKYGEYDCIITPKKFKYDGELPKGVTVSVANATYILGLLWDYTRVATKSTSLALNQRTRVDFGYVTGGARTRAFVFNTNNPHRDGFNADVVLRSYVQI